MKREIWISSILQVLFVCDGEKFWVEGDKEYANQFIQLSERPDGFFQKKKGEFGESFAPVSYWYNSSTSFAMFDDCPYTYTEELLTIMRRELEEMPHMRERLEEPAYVK